MNRILPDTPLLPGTAVEAAWLARQDVAALLRAAGCVLAPSSLIAAGSGGGGKKDRASAGGGGLWWRIPASVSTSTLLSVAASIAGVLASKVGAAAVAE